MTTKKAPTSLLEEMHSALATDLLKRIRSGSASSADLSVARQLLKDNKIDAVPVPDSPLAQLSNLPFNRADAQQRDEDALYN